MPVECAFGKANEVRHRTCAVGFVVAFEADRDFDGRTAEDASLDFDEGVFERTFGWIIVVPNMRLNVMHITCQGFALGDKLGLGSIDKVGEVRIATNVDLRGLLEMCAT